MAGCKIPGFVFQRVAYSLYAAMMTRNISGKSLIYIKLVETAPSFVSNPRQLASSVRGTHCFHLGVIKNKKVGIISSVGPIEPWRLLEKWNVENPVD